MTRKERMDAVRRDKRGDDHLWEYESVPVPRVAETRSMLDAVDLRNRGQAEMFFVKRGYFEEGSGWGYSKESPCVLSKDLFHFISEEKKYVEWRIYEEIIFDRTSGAPDLHCLRRRITRQALMCNGEDKYDILDVEVTGFLEPDLEFLKSDIDSNCGYIGDPEGLARHRKMASERRKGYKTQYWFKIPRLLGSEEFC